MKMPKSTQKMSFFYVYVSFLKEARIRTRMSIYNTRVRLEKMSKEIYFEIRVIWVVWVVMELTPLVATTLASTLTFH